MINLWHVFYVLCFFSLFSTCMMPCHPHACLTIPPSTKHAAQQLLLSHMITSNHLTKVAVVHSCPHSFASFSFLGKNSKVSPAQSVSVFPIAALCLSGQDKDSSASAGGKGRTSPNKVADIQKYRHWFDVKKWPGKSCYFYVFYANSGYRFCLSVIRRCKESLSWSSQL